MSNALRNKVEVLASVHGRSPLDLLELFNERAAIRRYCSCNVAREEAERLALKDVERTLEGRCR